MEGGREVVSEGTWREVVRVCVKGRWVVRAHGVDVCKGEVGSEGVCKGKVSSEGTWGVCV